MVGPTGGGPGTSITGATGGTLIATQVFTLDATTWNWTAQGMGILGYLSMGVAGNNYLEWTATIQKNSSTPIPLNGFFYYSASAYFSVPLNGVSLISEIGPTWLTFSNGDTVTFRFYARYAGAGAGPTVEVPPPGASVIISKSVIGGATGPASGNIAVSSPVTTPQELIRTNTYTFTNGLGATADLTLYDGITPQAPISVAVGATSASQTGYDAYTFEVSGPPPFPSSPITLSGTVAIPIGIDPGITYTFNNPTGGALTVSLWIGGTPTTNLGPIAGGGGTATAPGAGYTGYTVA